MAQLAPEFLLQRYICFHLGYLKPANERAKVETAVELLVEIVRDLRRQVRPPDTTAEALLIHLGEDS